MFLVLLTYLLLPILILCDVDDLILPPIKNTTQKYGLILIQGAKINNSAYIPLCKTIQQLFPFSLTIGLPGFVDSMPDPDVFDYRLQNTLNNMIKYGNLPNNEILNIFMAGHSLGGAILQDWTKNNQFNYSLMYPKFKYIAQIQLSSTITKTARNNNTQRLENYTIPTITISGELDGLFRVTRLIEQYYCNLGGDYYTDENIANFPVIYIQGMTHMQWASGTPPSHVYNYDLIPTISYDDAHQTGSDIITTYMQLQINGYENDVDNFNKINQYTNQTYLFGQQFINMLNLESFYSFKLPCYCNELTCNSQQYCNGGNTFISKYGLSTLTSTNIISDIDSFHEISPSSKNYKPTLNINNKQSTSVTENMYAITDDTGFCQTASSEIRTKLVSNQTIQYYLNNNKNGNDYNGCQLINLYSYQIAINNTPKNILNRYYNTSISEQIRFGNDIKIDDSKLWESSVLKYEQRIDENNIQYLNIQSPYFIKNMTKNEIGYHYCKIISPARLMEWIYIGSLKLKSSLAGNPDIPLQCYDRDEY